MKKLFLVVCLTTMGLCLSAQDKPKIAVMEFKPGIGVCTSQVNGLSDMLINSLFETQKFKIVERTQIDKIIAEQGFQKSKLSSEQVIKVGKILGVKYICVGTVNFIATDRSVEQVQTGMITGEFNLDVRITDVESGEIIATAGVTKSGSQTYRSLMPELAKEIARKIKGDSKDPILIAGYLYVSPDDFESTDGSTAKSICWNLNNTNYCGYNDWRIPTKAELNLIKSFANDLSLKVDKNYAKICSKCGGDGYYYSDYKCNYSNVGSDNCYGIGIKDGRVRLVRTDKRQ